MQLRSIVLLSLLLMLSSCAVMNEKECLVADWHMVGMEEGMRGSNISGIGQYRKACADYGIQPNLAAYKAGHSQGIRQFCSPQKAYEWGSLGQALPQVCPGDVHSNFLSQYNKGIKRYCTADTVYALGKSGAAYPHVCPEELARKLSFSFDQGKQAYQEINAYRSEISAISEKLQGTDERIEELETQLAAHTKQLEVAKAGIYSSETTDLEKVGFYRQRDQLKEMIKREEVELHDLTHDRSENISTIEAMERAILRIEKRPTPYLMDRR